MAKYYYHKYTVAQVPVTQMIYYPFPVNAEDLLWSESYYSPDDEQYHPEHVRIVRATGTVNGTYTFTESGNNYKVVFNNCTVTTNKRGTASYWALPNEKYQGYSSTTYVEGVGSLVTASLIAEYGTYPANGKYSDGYWYVVQGAVPLPPAPTPPIPSLSSLTPTSVYLSCAGATHIICNNKSQPNNSTFSGLTPNTSYRAYAVNMGDNVNYSMGAGGPTLTFTTSKSTGSTPLIPTASNITTTGVTLTSTPGSTIVISNGTTIGSGGTTNSLLPNSTYTAYAYMPEDSNYARSNNSGSVSFKTLQTKYPNPAAPTISNITSTSATITTSTMGCSIYCNGSLISSSSSGSIGGLSPNTTYSGYIVKPGDSNSTQSDSTTFSFTTAKGKFVTPTTPTVSNITATGVYITCSTFGSYIYLSGIGSIGSGGTINVLTPNTSYYAYAYIPGNSSYAESDHSSNVYFTTSAAHDLKVKINGSTKNFLEGCVKIDGKLKKILEGYTKIGGILKKL